MKERGRYAFGFLFIHNMKPKDPYTGDENIDLDKIEGPVNTCCCHFASSLSTWLALSPSPQRHPPM